MGEGRNFAGFKLERQLGRGATAQVYSAIRERDGSRVALKIFHPSLWDRPELRKRAIGEFRTISSLEHPNIVRVVEAVWDPQDDSTEPAVALEFVDGYSLEEFQSRLPYVLPEVAALVMVDVLSALEYAHGRGVIHRDLKPANILVSREGRVVVSDFGLAKMCDVSRLTLSGTILGSPDYMSPEQARGDVTTPRSDLFSAAAVLYFLVTGTRPFTRHTPLATLAAVSEVQCEPAQRRNPKLSPGLARILHKGLARNPEERFGSAAEFGAALRGYLDSIGLTQQALSFPAWMASGAETTLDALKTVSHSLTLRAEAELAGGAWDPMTETLAHLSQVAPESAAIPRLMRAMDEARRLVRRRRAMAWSGGAAAALALAGGATWLAVGRAPSREAGAAQAARTSAPVAVAPASVPAAPPAQVAAARPAEDPKLSEVERSLRDIEARHARLGTVRFDVSPEVKVFWDGRAVDSRSPLESQRLGAHRLRLEMKGKKPIFGRVIVSAGEPTVVRAR